MSLPTTHKPKRIANLSEIRKAVKKLKLPDTIRISQEAVVFDVPKFIGSGLTMLSNQPLKRIHRPCYDRMQIVLKELGLELIVEEYDKRKSNG